MARLHIGTSGFVYKHWRKIFYPEDLPARLWLSYYASVFSTCELNGTFYRLPRPEAVERWRDETPDGFLFAAKGSRFITHMKRLANAKEALDRYFDPVLRLGKKLAVVLWQLPPNMAKADPGRLDAFLRLLPKKVRQAFEFRAEGWYADEIADVLDRHGAAFCEHDYVKKPIPRPTGGFRYLRFHGATGKYDGRYGDGLRPYAKDLEKWRARGRDAYVYFNNDLNGYAVQDAMELSELVGEELPAPALERTPSPRSP